MRRLLFSLLCLFVAVLVYSQTQQGYVKTKGRLGNNGTIVAGTRLSGATVTIKGGNSVVSGNKGIFTLAIPGNNYYLQNVQKQGYVLTDPDVLSRQYVYSKNPLILVLETKEQQADDKLAAEKKIRRTLQRQLQDKEDEIELLKEQQKLSDEEYRKQLQELYDQQESNEKLISEMADRYSMIDFDEVDDFNRQISSLILEGKLMEADSLINSKGDIHTRAANYRQHKAANVQEEQTIQKRQKKLEKSKAMTQKELEDLAQDCYSKFEIFKMQHQNDSAAYYIEFRANLDSLNVEWQLNVGDFMVVYIVDYDKAMSYYQRIMTNANSVNKLLQHDIAICYNNIGYVYSEKGNQEEALKYYTRSLEIDMDLYGENHPKVAASYNNIGALYAEQELYEKAYSYYEKALNIRKNIFGDDAFETSISYNNIGMMYFYEGEFDNALQYLERVLSIRLALYGESHPDVAIAYNNLGGLYKEKDDMEKSIQYYEKALLIWKEIYGEMHPDVALAYNNLAFRYWAKNDYEHASEYLYHSLTIRKEVLGGNHPSVATSYNNIGGLYKTMGDYEKAEDYVNRGLNIRKKIYGDNHIDVAASYSNLGGIYLAKSDYCNAKESIEKALLIRIKLFGDKHPSVAQLYSNMGSVFEQEGQFSEAEKYYTNAYNIWLSNYPSEDNRVVQAKKKIDNVKSKMRE